MTKWENISGKAQAVLANKISDAMFAATNAGMELDEAVCVVLAVAADYGRYVYGESHLERLAEVVRRRKDYPLPKIVGESNDG